MENHLSLYQTFATVAESGNISKASKELFISQPAISKSIRRLEEELNTTLFIRTGKGVLLTEEGQVLYQHVKPALDTISQGEEALKRKQSLGSMHLRIGASTTLCKYILLPILAQFMKEHPHIRVSITCQSTFETGKLIEDGKLDIGLTGKMKNLPKMHFEKLGAFQDIFVATDSYLKRLDIPLNNSTELLARGNLMLLDEKNISRLYIDRYFQLHGIQASGILEIGTMDLLIEFAKLGIGIACVMKEFILNELNSGELIAIPIPDTIPKREVGFTYSSHSINQDAVDLFLSYWHHLPVEPNPPSPRSVSSSESV